MENHILKQNAIEVIRRNYWMLFLGTLIYSSISGISSSVTSSLQRVGVDSESARRALVNGDWQSYINHSTTSPLASLISNIFQILFTIFLMNILTVGLNKFYIKASTGSVDIGNIFEPFKNYMSVFKTMGMKYLYIALWSLLLIIPGIIKSFSYWMIPYILAENPNIDTNRAFEISMKTMNGEKGKCFYMYLSFLGWYLLGILCCCIGICFVNPYAYATYQEFYQYVKEKALNCGYATTEDFGETSVVI